jgi:hypothetical protein
LRFVVRHLRQRGKCKTGSAVISKISGEVSNRRGEILLVLVDGDLLR